MHRVVFVLAALALTACGGGGGGGGSPSGGGQSFSHIDWPIDTASARAATGGVAPPSISSSEIATRLSAIHAQADTLLLTDLHDLDFAFVGDISTNCRAGTCVSSEGQVNLGDLTFDDTDYQAVMVRNGVTLDQSRRETKFDDGITGQDVEYGAWLDHSAFAIWATSYYLGAISDGSYAGVVEGYSFGNDSGSRPLSGSAIWEGVMTGVDVEFLNAVQGDAAVTVDFARNDAGVAFTNVHDLYARSALPSMEWSGLAIGADGKFGAGDLLATFYGPNHAEVGGVFERNEIVGAFGAKRQ